jgi:hypothetical protein
MSKYFEPFKDRLLNGLKKFYFYFFSSIKEISLRTVGKVRCSGMQYSHEYSVHVFGILFSCK